MTDLRECPFCGCDEWERSDDRNEKRDKTID